MRGKSLSFLAVILVFVAISAYLSLSGNQIVAETPPQICKLAGEEWDYAANDNFPPFDCCSGLDACTDGYCCEVESNENPITGQMTVRAPFEPPVETDEVMINNLPNPLEITYDCYQNSDCGANMWTGTPYCKNGDIWQERMIYTCNNPGTLDSYCSQSDQYIEKQECNVGCIEGECETVSIILDYRCSQNSDCGTDKWLDNEYCTSEGGDNTDIADTRRTYTCHNPNTPSSYCTHSDEDKIKEDCGDSECDGWGSPYCYDNDVWHSRQCNSRGCEAGPTCYDGQYTDEEKVEECGDNECSNGECVEDYACSQDSDCGTNEYTGNLYCQDGDVYQDYRTHTCHNPRTSSSYCTYTDDGQKKEDCGSYGCSGGQCNSPTHTECQSQQCVTVQGSGTSECTTDNDCAIECSSNSNCGTDGWTGSPYCQDGDVYQTYTTYECRNPGQTSSYCEDSDNEQKKEDCGSYGCSGGQCNSPTHTECQSQQCVTVQGSGTSECTTDNDCAIECSSNSNCGTDGWTGSPYCQDGDVYQSYQTYTCSNPGQTSSSCSQSDDGQVKEDCGSNTCTNGQCDSGGTSNIDLVVSGLRVMWPPNPEAGDVVSFEFIITNAGTERAENIEFKLLSGESNWDAPNPLNLDAGKKVYVFYDHIYSEADTYIAKAIVDPSNQIHESNENNNQMSITVTVS